MLDLRQLCVHLFCVTSESIRHTPHCAAPAARRSAVATRPRTRSPPPDPPCAVDPPARSAQRRPALRAALPGPAPAGPARPASRSPPPGPPAPRARAAGAPAPLLRPLPPPPQGPPALIHISRDQPRAHELTKYIGQPSPAPGRVSARASWSLNRWAPDRSAVRYLWGMVPVSPARTTGSFPKMEDNGTTYMTSLPGISS
jgi:hypothetical protein